MRKQYGVVIFLNGLLMMSHMAVAGSRAELGNPEELALMLNQSEPCEERLTTMCRANQLSFARDFLKYDANDIKTGLVNALISYFPRSEVLFTEAPLPHDKTNKNSISYRLRRQGYREADRTLTSIILLQKILLGDDPSEFATPIKPLNPDHAEIQKIRQMVFDFLTEQPGVALDETVFAKVKIEKLHAMIVRLIFHDLGKIPGFIQEYKARLQDDGIDTSTLSADHNLALCDIQDRYLLEMMPPVACVLPGPRSYMKQSDIGAFNPGRVFQFEAPARHILALAGLPEQSFKFSIIKEIFDVGGARGSEHPNGSFWIKPVISTYFKLYEDYEAGKIGANPVKVASYYGELLQVAGEELGLPTATADDLAIVKLARLFRLNQFPKESRSRRITALLDAVNKLDSKMKQSILEELKKNGINDGWALTLGYIPQISENIQTSLGTWVKDQAGEEKITDASVDRAMKVSLEVLFKAVQLARNSLAILEPKLIGENGEYTLELPGVADFVKKNGVDALEESELVFKPAGRNSAEIRAKQ